MRDFNTGVWLHYIFKLLHRMMDTLEKLLLIQKHFNLLKNKVKETNKQQKKKPKPTLLLFTIVHIFNHNLVMATKHQKIFLRIFSMVLKKFLCPSSL